MAEPVEDIWGSIPNTASTHPMMCLPLLLPSSNVLVQLSPPVHISSFSLSSNLWSTMSSSVGEATIMSRAVSGVECKQKQQTSPLPLLSFSHSKSKSLLIYLSIWRGRHPGPPKMVRWAHYACALRAGRGVTQFSFMPCRDPSLLYTQVNKHVYLRGRNVYILNLCNKMYQLSDLKEATCLCQLLVSLLYVGPLCTDLLSFCLW